MNVRSIRFLKVAIVFAVCGIAALLTYLNSESFRNARMGPIEVIRRELAHIKIQDIVVERDQESGKDVAFVIVEPDQLDVAFGDGVETLRRAAMKSGISVEVVLVEEWRKMHGKRAAPNPDAKSESN